MRKAIVTGASAGIGRALACELHARGYAVGVMARRSDLLEELRRQRGERVFVKLCDVSQTEAAMAALRELISEMDGVDLIVLNAGVGYVNPELDWELEHETILVNALGFAAQANVAYLHFQQLGRGQLVGISSIAALTASGLAPAYHATKSFVSSYLACLRQKATKAKLPIVVTDILPGYVNTPMAKAPQRFWVAELEEAAAQIANVIERKASVAYVTRRWRLIAWVLKIVPESIQRRF